MDYPKLLAPGKINQLELKNRVVMTAMGVGLANHDGTASAKTLQYFKERADGGVGLIITEYTRINEKDAIVSGEQLAMSQPKHVKAFQKVVATVHQAGAKIFVQLHHPGRENVPLFPAVWPTSNRLAKIIPGYWRFFGKVMGNNDRSSLTDPRYYQFMNRFMKPLRAPSDVPAGLGFSPFGNFKIKPLTIAEIHAIETQFVAAAKRVQASGADGVELHAGHGYLLNQFLSPYTNIRTDAYGGNTENRARIVKEIITGIRQHLGPDFPISVRLTVNEFYDKIGYPGQGITLAEGIKLAKLIEAYGADALNVTIANSDTQVLISEPISYPLGWRQPLVKAIKAAVNIPVIAVGVIRTPQQAEAILASGNQDFIGLARSLLADPLWVKKAEANTPQLINRCIGCLVCQESYEAGMMSGEPAICTVNPRAGHETEIPINAVKDGQKRPVLIIGAGPAGLTAARELALRDFEVTIIEQSASTGGQVKLAERPPHKEKIAWSYLDLEAQARQAGAKIRLNTAASSELLKSYHPYAVLIATGGTAFKPNIPGATQNFVYTTTPILQGNVTFHNQKIVVVGSGMTGLETSELLVQQHNQVTIVEMADQIAPGVFAPNVWDVTERLKAGNVRYLTGRKLVAIDDHTVTLIQQNHVRELLQADAVVLSLGVCRNVPLAKSWAGLVSKLVVIGDANRIGRIKDAIHAGFKAARNL